jgi:putative ABC transport system permease protein
MLLRLAWATLTRHRSRTLLAVLGVAVSAAMLLDMVMLSSGMRASFKDLLLTRGFQLRVAPKGTLPFDTDATIPEISDVLRTLGALPDVLTLSPVLGGQLHFAIGARAGVITATTIGADPTVQGDYEITEGRAPASPNELVASDDFLRASGARIGDTLSAAAGYDAQLRSFAGRRTLTVVGRAHFLYTAAGQLVVSVPLST